MAPDLFEKVGSRLTAMPEGRLDTLKAPELESELQRHLDGVQDMIMDFKKVEYISSRGIRILLTTAQKMQSRGGSLKLIVPETVGRCRIEMIAAADLIGWMRDGGVR